MLLPSKLDMWFAEAVTRVYAPWLTSTCIGISDQQRREVTELIDRARRAAYLPPLEMPATRSPRCLHAFPSEPRRAHTGRWTLNAA